MLNRWDCRLRLTRHEARLLVTCEEGDILKARLNPHPNHPRALLTLLEGVSLWSGQPLSVALTADDLFRDGRGSILLGDELWPAESQLVRFNVVHPARRKARLPGLGDFRAVRSTAPRGEP